LFFIDILHGKFAIIWFKKIPLHTKCVATLPGEMKSALELVSHKVTF